MADTHAAEAALIALKARYAADHARADGLPDDRVQPLVKRAAQLESRSNLLAAEAAYYNALTALRASRESQVKDAKKREAAIKAAEKSLTTQQTALAKAREAAAQEPKDYTPVGTVYPSQSTGRRLALAHWVTDKRNPLTARVAVNHIWLRHMSSPLVDDVSDFGLRSKRPDTLPLLDWLADEFMSSGWDMKRIHRQIVLSNTYGRSTEIGTHTHAVEVDPENRLYWRANLRRLDAEEIRDSLLAAAGELDRTFSGPDLSEDDGEKIHRRSIYFRHAYEKQVAMLVLFDGASPNECYRRSPSILPQQALALSNSQLARELSRKMATSIRNDIKNLSGQEYLVRFVDELFGRVLNRQPSADEQRVCVQFLQSRAGDQTDVATEQSLAHALINHNDFVVAR